MFPRHNACSKDAIQKHEIKKRTSSKNGCIMLSNIVVLFGLNKLILGFYPSSGEKEGNNMVFTPFCPLPG